MSNPIPEKISLWQYANKSNPKWMVCAAIFILALFVWGLYELKTNDTWNVMITCIVFIIMWPTVIFIHWKRYLKGKQR